MEISWTTFLLEIINFVVLVWILKHFLYRPVLAVIERRRAGIEAQLAQARDTQQQATELKTQYEGRLADWDTERRQARDRLAEEMEKERTRQLGLLSERLEQEREKSRVALEKQAEEAARQVEQRAVRQAGSFATRLLMHASSAELEARLLELLLTDLAELPADNRDALKQQWGEPPQRIQIASAYPLGEPQRQRLESALAQATGLDLPFEYTRDETLLAGLQIGIGAWLLACNVRDELTGFTEFAYASR